MSRIRALGREEADPIAQESYDQDLRRFGLVLNTTGVLAYRPPILRAARRLGGSLADGGVLPAGLRALVCTRIATLVGCPF